MPWTNGAMPDKPVAAKVKMRNIRHLGPQNFGQRRMTMVMVPSVRIYHPSAIRYHSHMKGSGLTIPQ